MTLTAYCDGGSRGNPGPAASAFVVYKDSKEIFSDTKFLGETTNNVAEYTAIQLAMKWVVEYSKTKGVEGLEFFLDSELAVKQLTGVYRVKSDNLKSIYQTIKSLERGVGFKVNYTHVKREKNSESDKLVNQTLDSHAKG